MAALEAALHERVAGLRLVELLVQVDHNRPDQLDHCDHEGSEGRRAEVTRQRAAERLQNRQRVRLLLREVPLADGSRDRHDADGVDELFGPEEGEEVPEGENHVAGGGRLEALADQRAVDVVHGVRADHLRAVAGCT